MCDNENDTGNEHHSPGVNDVYDAATDHYYADVIYHDADVPTGRDS